LTSQSRSTTCFRPGGRKVVGNRSPSADSKSYVQNGDRTNCAATLSESDSGCSGEQAPARRARRVLRCPVV
jgi:hypothetical protein